MSTQAERDALWMWAEATAAASDTEKGWAALETLSEVLGELPTPPRAEREVVYEGEPVQDSPVLEYTVERRRRESAPWQGTRIALATQEGAEHAARGLEDTGWFTRVVRVPGGVR